MANTPRPDRYHVTLAEEQPIHLIANSVQKVNNEGKNKRTV